MIEQPVWPVVAIITGAAAVVVWGIVLVRALRAAAHHVEHRAVWPVMAITAFVASVGTLASAIGFAAQRGLIEYPIPADWLSAIASIGRGALLMAGIIVLTHYRPPERAQ
jgi:hypothetical protein